MHVFRIATCFLLLVFSLDALAGWRKASSNHFVIYADASEKEIRLFSDRLERYHSAMTALFPAKIAVPSPSNRVTIYVVKNVREVRRLLGEAADARFISGFYVPRAGGSVAIVPPVNASRGSEISDSERILMHEYAHHFMAENASYLVPRWFSEGFAEYFSTTGFETDGSVSLGLPAMHRAQELMLASKVTIEQLLDTKAYAARKSRLYNNFYGRSWALFHYLYSTNDGVEKLTDYLNRLNRGDGELESAVGAFGDLATLDDELERYLKQKKMQSWKVLAKGLHTGEIEVQELNAGESAIMPIVIRSNRGVDTEAAAEVLVDAREVAARFPDEPAVQAALAEAEFDAGNDELAIIAADKAIAADPATLVQKGYALTRKATNTMDTEDWATARKHFVAINKIENNHPVPLVYYYQTFVQQGNEPSKAAVDGLEWALELAPYDKNVRMMVAQQQMKEKRFAAAIRTIAPLAYDPHGSEDNPAIALLETARKELSSATDANTGL